MLYIYSGQNEAGMSLCYIYIYSGQNEAGMSLYGSDEAARRFAMFFS